MRPQRRAAVGRGQAAPGAPRRADLALADLVLGHAVVAQQHVVGREAVELLPGDRRDRVDEARVCVELGDQAQARYGRQGAGGGEEGVRRAGRRCAAVLGVQRDRDDVVAAGLLEAGQGEPQRGVAVAHAQDDLVALAQAGLERPRQRLAVQQQRRALGGPDLLVGVRAAGGPGAQDDAVQQQPAGRRVHVEHARVGQELRQVAPHGGHVGRVGGAEVDEQDAFHGRLAIPLAPPRPLTLS